MTAQERQDVRWVQKSRAVWHKRAVRRGEDRRRLRERHKEVDSSRAAWRERALAAEHRVEPRAIEPHQLQSALTHPPEPTTIDNTPFFSALGFSSACVPVPSRSAPRVTFSVPFSWLALA